MNTSTDSTKQTSNNPANNKGDNEIATLSDELKQIFAAILRRDLEEIDTQKTFAEQGMDSILGFEFIQEIKARLKCNLSTALLYQYKTIHQLAEYILTNNK